VHDVLPGPVRWARILVFVMAGLVFVQTAVQLLGGVSAAEAGSHLVAAGTSGGAQLVLGLLMHRRGWPVLAVALLVQVLAVAATLLAAAQAVALTQLLLPVAVIVLVLTRPAREHYLGA